MISWLEENRKFAVLFTVIIALQIFVVSSIPGSKTPSGVNLSIIYHLIVFFLFSFFLLISITGKKELKLKHLLLTLAISLIYAVLDEVHQIFVSLRNPSLFDVLVDGAGILLAIFVYIYYKKRIRR